MTNFFTSPNSSCFTLNVSHRHEEKKQKEQKQKDTRVSTRKSLCLLLILFTWLEYKRENYLGFQYIFKTDLDEMLNYINVMSRQFFLTCSKVDLSDGETPPDQSHLIKATWSKPPGARCTIVQQFQRTQHVSSEQCHKLHVCSGWCLCLHVCSGWCLCLHVCSGWCLCLHVCSGWCLCLHVCSGWCLCLHVCSGWCLCLHVCSGWCLSLRACKRRSILKGSTDAAAAVCWSHQISSVIYSEVILSYLFV